jgi:hypothetical protein
MSMLRTMTETRTTSWHLVAAARARSPWRVLALAIGALGAGWVGSWSLWSGLLVLLGVPALDFTAGGIVFGSEATPMTVNSVAIGWPGAVLVVWPLAVASLLAIIAAVRDALLPLLAITTGWLLIALVTSLISEVPGGTAAWGTTVLLVLYGAWPEVTALTDRRAARG